MRLSSFDPMTSSASPSSRINSSAAGLVEIKLSGPHSSTLPSMRSVRITPPSCGLLSMTKDCAPALRNSYEAARPEMPPPAMTARIVVLRLEVADDVDHSLHVVDVGFRINAVAKIEDVAGPCAGALQQFVYAHFQLRQRRQQHCGIEVALDRRTI